MRQELGLNAFGERVYIDDRGDLKVVNAVTGKSVFTPTTKPRVVQYRAPSLAQQVAAEIAKHPGVIASVDEERGTVATYLAPVAYYTTTTNLTPSERDELERERKRLTQALRTMTPHERAKAMTRLNVIESELRRGRTLEEAERVKREREVERERERGESV